MKPKEQTMKNKLVRIKAKAVNDRVVQVATHLFNHKASARLPFTSSDGVVVAEGPRTAISCAGGVHLTVRGAFANVGFYTPATCVAPDAPEAVRLLKKAVAEFNGIR